MKRLVDAVVAAVALLLLSPLLGLVSFAIWFEDGGAPLYIACRLGSAGREFQMVKFRTMIVGGDRSGVASTAADDPRITAIGRLLRRSKLDELPQLWNVLRGQMSLVGPRPNVPGEVALYTAEEFRMLGVRPGLTDLASIVFADEGDILDGQIQPDIAYRQLIRPHKSELAVFYVDHHTLPMDARIMALTLLNTLSRERALVGVANLLGAAGARPDLCRFVLRHAPLVPVSPPGASEPLC